MFAQILLRVISKQKERDARISNVEVCHLKLLKRAKGMHVISLSKGATEPTLASYRIIIVN